MDGSALTKPQLCCDYGIDVLIDDDGRHLGWTEVPNLRRILLKSGCSEPMEIPGGVELARSWRDVLSILRGESRDLNLQIFDLFAKRVSVNPEKLGRCNLHIFRFL